MSYPIENRLRPAHEFHAAAISAGAIAATFYAPTLFLFSKPTAGMVALVLAGHGLWRARQGLNVLRYRRNLRRLPNYSVNSDEIPWSKKRMFLGMGFRWDQRHTQRLLESRHPQNRKFVEHGKLYQFARKLEVKLEHTRYSFVSNWTAADKWWNPVRPLPPVGGDPALHGVEPDEEPIWTDLGERVGHTVVLGTTRVGKTRLAELLIAQDIRRGDVTIVFDPKGDAALLRRMYAEAKRAGRENDFFMFHLGFPDISARYNPVGSFSKVTEVATRTANPLPDEGQSSAFRQFAWRFVNVIARTMVALGEKPSFESIYRFAVNADSLCERYFEYWLDRDRPNWRHEFDEGRQREKDKAIEASAKKTGRALRTLTLLSYIRDLELRDAIGDSLMSILSNEKSYFEKLVSSLYPLLEKLTTGKMAELISPSYFDLDDKRPIIDWMEVINRRAIVYIGLDSLTDYEVAGAVGNAMFADLTSIAGKLYKYGQGYGQLGTQQNFKVSLHADEFNELIGDEFVPLLNKAGGAGFQVTVYTQTWSDVEAKIGSPAKAEQIGGNLNTLIMLRVKNSATAEILTNQLPEVNVVTKILSSSASDTNDPAEFAEFASKNEDRLSAEKVPMLSAADLVQLPKGQAFALLEGGRLYKIRLPLPTAANDELMPDDLEQIAQEMERRYHVATVGNTQLIVEGRGSGF